MSKSKAVDNVRLAAYIVSGQGPEFHTISNNENGCRDFLNIHKTHHAPITATQLQRFKSHFDEWKTELYHGVVEINGSGSLKHMQDSIIGSSKSKTKSRAGSRGGRRRRTRKVR